MLVTLLPCFLYFNYMFYILFLFLYINLSFKTNFPTKRDLESLPVMSYKSMLLFAFEKLIFLNINPQIRTIHFKPKENFS